MKQHLYTKSLVAGMVTIAFLVVQIVLNRLNSSCAD